MSDYYSLLEVSSTATEAEIRAAYRRKAKVMHPDVNKSNDAHSRFVLLTTAYETLINPQKREKYNLKYRYGTSSSNSNNAYQQWVEAQKAKARYEAQMRHYEFLRNREKFKQSKLYFLAIWVTHIARLVAYAFGVAVILICLVLVFHLHFMLLFFLLPFICGGIYLIKWTNDWFQETRRYF
ncbi:MAG: DnaJ domain-containing protein [Cytophagaceae bacterium]|nr:DnaJ domain-containing protein [Cytophagaceae bacterium]